MRSGKTLGQLGEEEARGEGFDSVETLRRDLEHYYSGPEPAPPVTVIWFEVVQS
jgi:hypothetical protein